MIEIAVLSSCMAIAAIVLFVIVYANMTTKTPGSSATNGSMDVSGGSGGAVPGVPQSVLTALGVDAQQLAVILGIINGAEQSSVNVVKAADGGSVYGYCENISDGRGVTLGIAGFTTRDKSAMDVFNAYGASSYSVAGDPNACKKGNGKGSTCPFCTWVRARGSDPKWIAANWAAYMNGKNSGYIGAVAKMKPQGASALAVGLMLDCAMNAGIGSEGHAWGLADVVKNTSGATPEAWCTNFIANRIAHFTGNSGESRWRMAPWKALIAAGKFDLRGVDVCKVAWCNENGLGKMCGGCSKK